MKTFSQYLTENARASIVSLKHIVKYLISDGMRDKGTFVGGVMTMVQELQQLSSLPNPKLKRLIGQLQQFASTWHSTGQTSLMEIRQTLQLILIELKEYEQDLFSPK